MTVITYQNKSDRNRAICAAFPSMPGTISLRVRRLSEQFGMSEPGIRVVLTAGNCIGRHKTVGV